MGEGSLLVWDAYVRLVGEVDRLAEVIGAGLSVAIRLNYRVMSAVVGISARLIQLMLMLITKTKDLFLLVRDDIVYFLSDIGSGVNLLLVSLRNAFLFSYTHHYHLIKYTLYTALLLALVMPLLFLCKVYGVLDVIVTANRCAMRAVAVLARSMARVNRTLVRCTTVVVHDVARCTAIILQILGNYVLVLAEKCLTVAIDVACFIYLGLSLVLSVLKCRGRLLLRMILSSSVFLFTLLYIPSFVITFCNSLASLYRSFHSFLDRRLLLVNSARRDRASLEREAQDDSHRVLERRINVDIVGMGVQQIAAYLQTQNTADYEYQVTENERGELAVSVVRRQHRNAPHTGGMRHVFGARLARMTRLLNIRVAAGQAGGRKRIFDRYDKRLDVSFQAADFPECVVCLDKSRSVLLLPCRHLCVCAACYDSIRRDNNTCPICRVEVRTVHQVFV